jgi:hypothetical protein
MDLIVSSDATVGISIAAFEGLGAFVCGFDVVSDFAGDVALYLNRRVLHLIAWSGEF